ncbi:MAG TPA: cupin domain-containing protein [Methylotenera sp.]|nr:cupin domain-containing protein [Methylotenera sp.]
MKINLHLLLGFIFLYFPLNASALDASATIKVTPLIQSTQSWNGATIAYPAGQAQITGLMIEIAPGADTGWHQHPAPSFGVITQGTLEVTLRDGKVKRLQAGDALIEVVNTDHIGRNVGDVPVKLIVFYAGTVGQVLTVKTDEVKY